MLIVTLFYYIVSIVSFSTHKSVLMFLKSNDKTKNLPRSCYLPDDLYGLLTNCYTFLRLTDIRMQMQAEKSALDVGEAGVIRCCRLIFKTTNNYCVITVGMKWTKVVTIRIKRRVSSRMDAVFC